jgi:hypothetical protein
MNAFAAWVALAGLIGNAATPVAALGQRGSPPDSATRRAVSGVIRGRVTRTDSVPIVGADVWLITVDRHENTDSSGDFRFTGLAPGPLLLEVRRIGFASKRDTVSVDADLETTRRYFLAAQNQTLDTVRTTAQEQKYLSPNLRGFEERRAAGQGGHFITDSALRRNENSTLTNVISSRVPGVMVSHGTLVSSRKPCRGAVLMGKGCVARGGDCYVSIFVDGVLLYKAQMADANVPPPDLAKLSVTQFGGVEFYAGGVAAPVGMHADDDGCGALWLWTRER